MAKEKSFQIGVVNVTMHPHSPEKYGNLLKTVYGNKITSKIRGSEWGMIGSLREETEENEKILFGQIYKFLNINPNEKWLDVESLKSIDPSEDGKPIPVPENIKPNLKEISYIFHLDNHRLFFESSEIAASSIVRLLSGLFSEKKIKKEFGAIDLTAESSHEIIKRIISIPRITKVDIRFNRPNGDDFSGTLEQRVLERFEKQNIRHSSQISSTSDKEGIVPDEEMQALMNVAKSNGRVRAEGYDQSQKIKYSTEEHPIIQVVKYNPELETKMDAMILSSLKMLKKIVS